MKISKSGIDFIKGFESFVPYVYDDLVPPKKGKYPEWKGGPVKGTLTIGYGHTNAAKHPLKIKKGLVLDEQEACCILDVDLDECEEAVSKLVTVDMTQGQFDALVSFAFNCGAGKHLKSLIAPMNRGDYAGTRRKFDSYTRSKGQVLRGLQRRRDGEQALWDSHYSDALTPDVVNPEVIIEHPAEVDAPPGPLAIAAQSKTVWMQLAAPIIVIWGYAQDGTRWLFETILSFVATLPGLGNDIEASLGTARNFSTWLGLPFAQISLGVVVAFCAFSIYRHVRDKLNGGAA